MFNLESNKLELLKETTGSKPSGHNCHTGVILKGKMLLFGGILEVTKESDEVFIFDFATSAWSVLTLESPAAKENNSNFGL